MARVIVSAALAAAWCSVPVAADWSTPEVATRSYYDSGIVAGGVGGRYLFRPQNSLWVGLDLARGPEDVVLYVQVGHAW